MGIFVFLFIYTPSLSGSFHLPAGLLRQMCGIRLDRRETKNDLYYKLRN